jgi:hypothetical protein
MALRDTLENVLREYDSAKLTTFAAVSSLPNFRSSLPAKRPAAFTARSVAARACRVKLYMSGDSPHVQKVGLVDLARPRPMRQPCLGRR